MDEEIVKEGREEERRIMKKVRWPMG